MLELEDEVSDPGLVIGNAKLGSTSDDEAHSVKFHGM